VIFQTHDDFGNGGSTGFMFRPDSAWLTEIRSVENGFIYTSAIFSKKEKKRKKKKEKKRTFVFIQYDSKLSHV